MIVGAPVDKGGTPFVPRAGPPTKNARLSRAFEYDANVIQDECHAAEKIQARYRRTHKRLRRAPDDPRGKGPSEEFEDIEEYPSDTIPGIEYEHEEYHITPLYHARDLQDGSSSSSSSEEEEYAVFFQTEHRNTGLLNQAPMRPHKNLDGEQWTLAKRVSTSIPEEQPDADSGTSKDVDYEAHRLDGGHLEDLELDYTAHPCFSNTPRYVGPNEVHNGKKVCHAFHQVPGRPNVYAFGTFKGTGFQGCGLKDSWSDPKLILRRDMHVKSWEDNSYDYVLQEPGCTAAMRKDQNKFSRAKPSHLLHLADTSRRESRQKLDCLTLQFKEYCQECAFEERAIDHNRIVLWQGDPKPRVVFLFKAVTKKVVGSAPYNLSSKCSKNHLGILQTALGHALEDIVEECYKHSYGENIAWQDLQEFVKAMVPMCCQDTGAASIDTTKGGIAILYGVPIYDPTGWGKHEIDEYGHTVYDTDYNSSSKKKGNTTWNPTAAEFPDNVLNLTSFYVQKALDIMSPMVVVSLNKFLTKYLNSGLESKMLQWAREVRVNKWFRVKLLSARGRATTASSSKSKSKSKLTQGPRVIQMIDPETGIVTAERRAETFGIRSFHPFYVTQNPQERHPVVKQTMSMIAKRLFRELDMESLISGKGHTLATFYMNPVQAMKEGKMKKKAQEEPIEFPPQTRWISGNIVCRDATQEQIYKLVRKYKLIDVFLLCDCENKGPKDCKHTQDISIEDSVCNVRKFTHLKYPSCSKDNFPPNVIFGPFVKKLSLWPVQWLHDHISGKEGNHFALPSMKGCENLKAYRKTVHEGMVIAKTFIDQACFPVPLRRRGSKKASGDKVRAIPAQSRLSLKHEWLELSEGLPSGLFTKRMIVDYTRRSRMDGGAANMDVAIYFSSILETLERTFYVYYMKDYYDGKRTGIAGAQKPSKKRKGFKRVKQGGRYLTRAEQLPSMGKIIGYIIKAHTPCMVRLKAHIRAGDSIEEEEEEEGKEHEEEEEEEEEEETSCMWNAMDWTEKLSQVGTEAKEAYVQVKGQLAELS